MTHARTTDSARRGQVALVIGASLFAGLLTRTASADVVTLESLEAQAITDSPSLEAREARVRAAAARIEGIRAEMRPRLTFDVGVQASPGAIVPQDCENDGNPATTETCYVRGQATTEADAEAFIPAITPSAVVRFEGVLYDFGRTRARVRAGEAEAAALETDIEAAETAIVRTVRGAYLSWLAVSLRRRAAEVGLATAEQRVRDFEAGVRSGIRSEADKDGAEIEAARIRLELARARSAEATSRRTLARLVGVTLPEDAEPDATVLDRNVPALSARNDASLRVLELRRDVARAGARAYALRHAPILTTSLQVGIGGQFVPGGNIKPIGSPSYQVSIGLTVPLWDPRAGRFLEAEAAAQAAAIEASIIESRASMDAAELEARARLDATTEEIALAAAVVVATTRAAEGADQRFRVAGGSIETVLSARERQRRAEDELMRSRLDRADAVLRLLPVR